MLYTALIFGLLSSFHCIGMCGPIGFALPIDRTNPKRGITQTGLYHIGRLLSYASIGLLFGTLGKGLYLAGFQQRLSILLGVVMILVILIPVKYFNKYSGSILAFAGISKLKAKMGIHLRKGSFRSIFTIGVLNGFLPCGMVYIALFGALGMADLFQGSLYMIFFGLGTIPLMTIAVYSKSIFSPTFRTRAQRLVPVFVVLIGVLFILRGLNLGIPYISPTDIQLQIANVVEVCD